MGKEFFAHGGVATPALIAAIQQDKGPWAHAVLGQSWGMPENYRNALLNGDAEWQIPNEKTLIIILAESQ